jgi:4-hydroxyphenylpyruvate dioxygenase-like putative hemolysin
VTTSFLKAEKIRLNYFAATDPQSAIAKFGIEKREKGIHHVALP